MFYHGSANSTIARWRTELLWFLVSIINFKFSLPKSLWKTRSIHADSLYYPQILSVARSLARESCSHNVCVRIFAYSSISVRWCFVCAAVLSIKPITKRYDTIWLSFKITAKISINGIRHIKLTINEMKLFWWSEFSLHDCRTQHQFSHRLNILQCIRSQQWNEITFGRPMSGIYYLAKRNVCVSVFSFFVIHKHILNYRMWLRRKSVMNLLWNIACHLCLWFEISFDSIETIIKINKCMFTKSLWVCV